MCSRPLQDQGPPRGMTEQAWQGGSSDPTFYATMLRLPGPPGPTRKCHELPAYRHSVGGADRPVHGGRLFNRRWERRMIALLIAAGMNLASYWNADKLVLAMHEAREVDETTAPDLVQLVAELAHRAGLSMPRVYVMDNPQPNAFATGRNPEHAAVAVTTGLLQMLSREEVAGVIAHELAHVKNRDTLTMTITATIAGAIC